MIFYTVGDDGKVRLVIGAAGGTRIPTAMAQAIVRNQFLKGGLISILNKLFH